MPAHDLLPEQAARFEAHRGHLQAVAYRMLGSLAEAEDAVQETWLRLSRSNPADVDNIGGWPAGPATGCGAVARGPRPRLPPLLR